MTTATTWIASRKILIVKPDSKKIVVTLRLGTPYQTAPEEWACAVALEGLYERLHDAHGIDAWQALQLAQRLQVNLLTHQVEEGALLFCHEPPSPVSVEELFDTMKKPLSSHD
jgi:hypothetical protein